VEADPRTLRAIVENHHGKTLINDRRSATGNMTPELGEQSYPDRREKKTRDLP
jgi:hypothetical protein